MSNTFAADQSMPLAKRAQQSTAEIAAAAKHAMFYKEDIEYIAELVEKHQKFVETYKPDERQFPELYKEYLKVLDKARAYIEDHGGVTVVNFITQYFWRSQAYRNLVASINRAVLELLVVSGQHHDIKVDFKQLLNVNINVSRTEMLIVSQQSKAGPTNIEPAKHEAHSPQEDRSETNSILPLPEASVGSLLLSDDSVESTTHESEPLQEESEPILPSLSLPEASVESPLLADNSAESATHEPEFLQEESESILPSLSLPEASVESLIMCDDSVESTTHESEFLQEESEPILPSLSLPEASVESPLLADDSAESATHEPEYLQEELDPIMPSLPLPETSVEIPLLGANNLKPTIYEPEFFFPYSPLSDHFVKRSFIGNDNVESRTHEPEALQLHRESESLSPSLPPSESSVQDLLFCNYNIDPATRTSEPESKSSSLLLFKSSVQNSLSGDDEMTGSLSNFVTTTAPTPNAVTPPSPYLALDPGYLSINTSLGTYPSPLNSPSSSVCSSRSSSPVQHFFSSTAPSSRSTSPSPYASDSSTHRSSRKHGLRYPGCRFTLTQAKAFHIAKQYQDAFDAFKELANHGNKEAEFYYGYYYLYKGTGKIHRDQSKGTQLLYKSAKKGCVAAEYCYAQICFKAPQTSARGAEFLKRAADKGHLKAMAQYGEFLCLGKHTIQMDSVAGEQYLHAAYEKGHQPAHKVLEYLSHNRGRLGGSKAGPLKKKGSSVNLKHTH